MRRYIGLLAVASVALLIGLGAPQERAPSEPKPDGPKPGLNKAAFVPDQILVKVKDNVPADAIIAVNRRNGARLEEKIPYSRVSVVDLPEGLSVAEAVELYEASPEVEIAEPNYRVLPAELAPTPNDPGFPKMWALNNRGQYGGTFDADIDAPEAWRDTTGSADTVVAVIDTGMDINHRDLKDNIWTNPDEIADNNIDDDINGYVDDVHGWDFRNTTEDNEDNPRRDGEDNSVFDGAEDTHGTHVAGTIAAAGDNAVGVTGVDWQIKIMPLKFIGPGNASEVGDAIEAINYAVKKGAKISNNSWGYDFSSKILEDEIDAADEAGHLVVAAAMNGGPDFVGDDNDVTPIYPASYDNSKPNDPSNIISVAASNNKDELTSFSNYGDTSVDLAAPGKDILSTLPGDRYDYGYGTSMATPHVTGVAALIKSQDPQRSDEEIRARILESVDKKASLRGKLVTGGRLNAAKALGANTAPVILNLRPLGRLRDRTPIISATVRDDEAELTKAQIKLYVDGRLKQSFSYDQANDKLTYRSGKLASRRHRVQVVADDGQGLEETRTWTFKVVRRR